MNEADRMVLMHYQARFQINECGKSDDVLDVLSGQVPNSEFGISDDGFDALSGQVSYNGLCQRG